jgi:aspartyl-tRNA synthetase
VGNKVVLAGWLASSRRVNADLSFHSLRDSTGSVQLKAQLQQIPEGADNTLLSLPLESVVHIEGVIEARPEGTILAKDLPSGSIEVRVTSWKVLNAAKAQLPFYPEKEHELPKSEETRIQYRYLDLRRRNLTDNIRLRSLVAHTVRDLLFRQGESDIGIAHRGPCDSGS